MTCATVTGINNCVISTIQESSLLDGTFQLGTTWPHEFVAESPAPFSSGNFRWNSNAGDMKTQLESVLDGADRVFGTVNVVRSPFVPSSQDRWSGGYLWMITFTSRGGNIPAMSVDGSSMTGSNVVLEVSDENSGLHDTFFGLPDSSSFSVDTGGTARDGNQVSGVYALSWAGNSFHPSVNAGDVFSVRTGGSGSDQHTALSAPGMEAKLTEHIFGNVPSQVLVTRSSNPTQWMGYTYSVVFKHQDVGGDIAPFVPVVGSNLNGMSASVQIDEAVKGTSMRGTFQLRFEGETTRPINHDATAEDMQDALNTISSIAPSAVIVTRTAEPVKTGPASGNGGMSTQVGGYVWSVTFASNTWRDPAVTHGTSYLPGNWFGPGVSRTAIWDSGLSKAWGKNVGNVPLIDCIDAGLWTTNGAIPTNGCHVKELVAGTDPLGGYLKLCLDSSFSPNNVMSVELDSCTSLIEHNALATTEDSGGDGSSMEEKLEALPNVGDVSVVRSPVNPKTGGYTWTIQFERDADGPCHQRDDIEGLCNAPGDVPKICHPGGSIPCDTSSLRGSCMRPGSCSKLTVLDAADFVAGTRPPGSNDVQIITVKDPDYVGWSDGSVMNVPVTKEFKLNVNGVETGCIAHNANAESIRSRIQAALDGGSGGTVHVRGARSEADAPNGFLSFATFYDTGDLPTMTPLYGSATCSSPFAGNEEVQVTSTLDGSFHSTACDSCTDGVVHRGEFSVFEVTGETLAGTLVWNALPAEVKSHLEAIDGRSVDITRTVLDKYGSIEWLVTFTSNPGETPPGTGDIDMLRVVQGPDSSGFTNPVFVNEVQKGSTGLAGSFTIDYFSSTGAREVSFDETPERLMMKLGEMSTVGHVWATRDCYPSCSSGGWGSVAVPESSGIRGGYEWRLHFLANPGTTDGFTFPNGSGNISPPSIDSAHLVGTDATAESTALTEGTTPLTGAFTIFVSGKETLPIPYNSDPVTIEQSLGDLSNTGRMSARSGLCTKKPIEGITVSASKDGNILQVTQGDLRQHLAPGDSFRVGGSHESNEQGEINGADGALFHGLATLHKGSPVLSDTAPSMPLISVGEDVRLGGNVFTIQRNGLEVQQLSVHRASGISDNNFYQLKLTIVGGTTESTGCLTFDATASEVQNTLNGISAVGADGVSVTKTQGTSGVHGDAHVYKIYFNAVADMNELVAEDCVSGLPGGVDASNSHAKIRTLIQGGSVDHQRVKLSADSGTTSSVDAFRLTITDATSATSVSTPCIEWGASTLDLNTVLSGAFADETLNVGPATVVHLPDALYDVEVSGFAEGTIVVGDMVNPGGNCLGIVNSVASSGKTVQVQALGGCSANAGDPFSVLQDTMVIESSNRQAPVSQITKVTLFSSAPVAESLGLYKLTLTLQGVSQTTSCLRYGASSSTVQAAIDGLHDYNLDGTIDDADWGHIHVEREGDGSSQSAYGYVYHFESKGSVSTMGVSAVLGSGSPSIEIAGIGDEVGCSDAAGTDTLITEQASTTDTSTQVTLCPSCSVAGKLHAGSRVKIDSSTSATKIFFVDGVSQDGLTITLSEAFAGTTTTGTATIYLVTGGVPRVSAQVVRQGQDEYIYDIFFTGSFWNDVPEITVNVFGDGMCTAGESHIVDGMNRNIAAHTVSDGGATLSTHAYALDRAIEASLEGESALFLLPPIFTVHDDTSEVQRIIVKDTDNAAIWGTGSPSFKLSFNGESTGCLSYSSSDSEVEVALNSLTQLCPSQPNSCVSVTRSTDAILAPNGFVFSVYFHGEAVSNKDVSELLADTTSGDCVPFSLPDGETALVETVSQGRESLQFTADQIPLGTKESSSTPGTWLGGDATDLSLYRVTGTYWSIQFDDYLGDMIAMSISHGNLPPTANAEVYDNLVNGYNPTSAVISGLSTGVSYYTRVSAATEVGSSVESLVEVSIPSTVPASPKKLSVGHAMHVNEVQSIAIRATHTSEVQTVTTRAIALPEVQEIVIDGTSGTPISAGFFSLRYPEVQVVAWSAGSPVTSGSFFLKLNYFDAAASVALGTGTIVTKQLKTPCISFDASAEDVRYAMEAGAIQNGFDPGAVTVTRSGDRSFSSGYGYRYDIEFVGGALRGNINQITSDPLLSGVDALGGSTCTSFVSATNDAYLDIWTVNESGALGTDTARAEILIAADLPVEEGQYELSVTHLGATKTTACIDWNAEASVLEAELKNLDNIDSVRVDRFGNGELSTNGGASTVIEGLSFSAGGSTDLVVGLENEDLSDLLFVGDRVQFSGQSDTSKFYTVTEVSSSNFTIGEDLHDHQGTVLVTRYFGYRFMIYFDGQGMHTDDGSGAPGYEPNEGTSFQVTTHNGCSPIKAFYGGVLKDFGSIPNADASVLIASKYGGGYTLAATASDDSSYLMAKAMLASAPMKFNSASVVQSLEDDESAVTFTVTYGKDDGDISRLICNPDQALSNLHSTCIASTVVDGNVLGGYFFLGSSGSISHDASAGDVELAIEGISGIGDISVTRSLVTGQGGFTWSITFLENTGDVDSLTASSSLTGKDASVTVLELVKGNQIEGFYSLSNGLENSEDISYDASPSSLENAIESLMGVGQMRVTSSGSVDSERGRSYLVTFLGAEAGDVDLLQADTGKLTGVGVTTTVKEEIKGSLALGTSLHVSMQLPRDCSTSQVTTNSCGNPLSSVLVSVDTGPTFAGSIVEKYLSPDYSLQIVRIGSPSFITQPYEQPGISGFFRLAYAGEETEKLTPFASAAEVRFALEALPGIVTASVSKTLSSHALPGVCIDVSSGSSTVVCSASCICAFSTNGLQANDMVKLGGDWFRVSAGYSGSETEFQLGSVDDALIQDHFVGHQDLVEADFSAWSGGYEWAITFHKVNGEVQPLTSPKHHLLPADSTVDIGVADCVKCLYIDGLSMWKQHYVRASAKNALGWSTFSEAVQAVPKAIPGAPTDASVLVIAGDCVEVSFSPPAMSDDPADITSYVLEWSHIANFESLPTDASCSSHRYGRCSFTDTTVPTPFKVEVCNLIAGETYFVRVAARNSVEVQEVDPSGSPPDNTNWSSVLSTVPEDQVPDPPVHVLAQGMARNSLQIIFERPDRDGGQPISSYVFSWDTNLDFSTETSISVDVSTLDSLGPEGNLVYNLIPTSQALLPGTDYVVRVQAVNSVGMGDFTTSLPVSPTGPPDAPEPGILTTLSSSALPITEAIVTWDEPSTPGGCGGDGIVGYSVDWWSTRKRPEVQAVRLQYTSYLSATTFSLSLSPAPLIKKETAMLPWDSPADLVRRELLNLGWDETADQNLLLDIEVTRSTLANGYAWSITFGDNPGRDPNDGDQVTLVGSLNENGDVGAPTLSISTIQDGRRSLGQREVQFLQILGTGTARGFYRLKFEGSEYTSYIGAHAAAEELKVALQQLSTVGHVEVRQDDAVDQSSIGTGGNLIHHYSITFVSNVGNVGRLVVDSEKLSSTNGDVLVAIFDGDNSLDPLNTKESGAVPGEMPVDFGSSGLLDSSHRSYTITGLIPGVEYFVVVSAKNDEHGYGEQTPPSPGSIIPPLQVPGSPLDVSVSVNYGFSDSILVGFNPSTSDGGDEIIRYRVELDPTAFFDNPITQDFECPTNNKRTVWRIETVASGDGKISGGSYTLQLNANGYSYTTSEIAYDAVALSSNETGTTEDLPNIFYTQDGSAAITTSPATNIEDMLFEGDRVRFSGQSAPYKYYEIASVSTNVATLSEPFVGVDGVQSKTTRHYGGRGDPSSSRIHCQVDEDLCDSSIEAKSGSVQNKLEDLSDVITAGVLVDRDGPDESNGFIWRVTFMDDAPDSGSDFALSLATNSLTTAGGLGSANVVTTLLTDGMTYSSCVGSLVVPSHGGLVKGMAYNARVSAANSIGYSLPMAVTAAQAPMVVPGAPTGVTLDVLSSTELRVMFGPPSDNGGDSIVQYQVDFSQSSDFSSFASTQLDYLAGGAPFTKTISGLIPGQFYYVRVSAINSQGQGISQESTPRSLNPHQKPSAPTNVRLFATSDTMMTIGWEDPVSDGGDAIVQYRVEWDTTPGFVSRTLPPDKGYIDLEASLHRSFTVELLSSAKTYYFRVAAINSAGIGVYQHSHPGKRSPSLQIPGRPHSLVASTGSKTGTIHVSWQEPRIPHHGIQCSGTTAMPIDCPTPYGGGHPASNGGDPINGILLEINENPSFASGDGARISLPATATSYVLEHLIPGRVYYVRVLSQNSIGLGLFCAKSSLPGSARCDSVSVSAVARA
uniref:Fibronectin type-III domain-containing protein n=1 Tax=Odontella aurita TaxID=265563 RepID=A0A7S4I964_9STRA|mmetsp:Transcript_21665/g.63659  ORF Transcript_21665/g.63659 Transcript_21665/m.63659 type:complete len:4227 (+) Transcript_21665:1-12681(+)